MRGGAYGWKAAEAGFILICWTNAIPLMPPWGSAQGRVGNNPLVIAVPRKEGAVVLDMALSQFSAGRLGLYRKRHEPLPVPGGFDRQGNLTRDAAAIAESGRPLPIGCWKGSGLALLLDLVAAIVSGGLASCQIRAQGEETRVSQIFLALDPAQAASAESVDQLVNQVLDDLHTAAPLSARDEVLYQPVEKARCAKNPRPEPPAGRRAVPHFQRAAIPANGRCGSAARTWRKAFRLTPRSG